MGNQVVVDGLGTIMKKLDQVNVSVARAVLVLLIKDQKVVNAIKAFREGLPHNPVTLETPYGLKESREMTDGIRALSAQDFGVLVAHLDARAAQFDAYISTLEGRA